MVAGTRQKWVGQSDRASFGELGRRNEEITATNVGRAAAANVPCMCLFACRRAHVLEADGFDDSRAYSVSLRADFLDALPDISVLDRASGCLLLLSVLR